MNLFDKIGLLIKMRGQNRAISIGPEQCVYEAIELMAEHGIGALLVTSDGKLVGVVSERDYARKVILKGKSSKHTAVREIMTSPAITVTPSHTVDDCMLIMTKNHFRHLPVMEKEKIVTMVSIGDLVAWIMSGQAQTIRELQSYITGSYPA